MNDFQRAEKALEALKQGRISHAEYERYLQSLFGTVPQESSPSHSRATQRRAATPEAPKSPASEEASGAEPHHVRRRKSYERGATLVVALGLTFILLWTLSTPGTGPTGFVTLEEEQPVDLLFNESGNETLNLTTTTLKLSGRLTNGSATITLVENGRGLRVGSLTTDEPYSIATDKVSYARGSPIVVSIAPEGAEYTLWLERPDGAKQTFRSNETLNKSGNYTLDALINESGTVTKRSTWFLVRNDTNASADEPRQPPTRDFSGLCTATCEMNETNGTATLVVELSEGATLNITSMTTGVEAVNSAPVQEATVPNITLEEGENTTLDLDEYFSDPDGERLTYDTMNTGVELAIEDSILTVTGSEAGTYTTTIYASDLEELVQSNEVTITVAPRTEANETSGEETVTPRNETENVTIPTNPITTNETDNTTEPSVENQTTTINSTGNATSDQAPTPVNVTSPNCDDPDPNKRDPSCFEGVEERYFKNGFIIENRNRKAVARFNAIGNLLITGDIVERSTEQPASYDFSVGYTDQDFNYVPTAWIETSTGELHLRGELHEERISLEVPSGTYSFQNRRGINLGYIQPRTGDMYIRGNLIPYRREI